MLCYITWNSYTLITVFHNVLASSSRAACSGMNLKRHLSLRNGDIDRRLSLGVAVPTSRTELIIQKSKEALARKNQLEKEQESQNAARIDQKGSTQNQKNGQVTTTGWQGKSLKDLQLILIVW